MSYMRLDGTKLTELPPGDVKSLPSFEDSKKSALLRAKEEAKRRTQEKRASRSKDIIDDVEEAADEVVEKGKEAVASPGVGKYVVGGGVVLGALWLASKVLKRKRSTAAG